MLPPYLYGALSLQAADAQATCDGLQHIVCITASLAGRTLRSGIARSLVTHGLSMQRHGRLLLLLATLAVIAFSSAAGLEDGAHANLQQRTTYQVGVRLAPLAKVGTAARVKYHLVYGGQHWAPSNACLMYAIHYCYRCTLTWPNA